MPPGRAPVALALAAIGSLALAATPAMAAKSGGKDDKPGKLKTATASTTSATTGLATATATCPGKSKVVGGGFVLQAPPASGLNDFLNPLESRRVSKKAWQVSAYHVDTGSAGPAMSLSAEAYCRTGLGKLKEKVVGETITGSGAIGTPVATCPLGRAALSGGFSITPPATPNTITALLYESLMAGGVGWQMRALNLTSPPVTTTYTSYAYCQAKGEKAPKLVTGTGTLPAPPPSTGLADTAPCSGKRDAFVGGFVLPSLFAAGVVMLPTESRHSGKGWRAAAARAAGSGPAAITALGNCS